jgi:hypothetical protein
MANENILKLQIADPTRADYALIESNLEFIAASSPSDQRAEI